MESCHPQKGGLSVCTVCTPLFIVCTPICPALVSVCVCVCACTLMSLLWSEMTLRNTAILPTVNIIQYHPTGINMVVLLLAEMCCCFSFSAWRRFLAPPCFLLGMCWVLGDDRDLRQGVGVGVLGGVAGDNVSYLCVFVGLQCVSVCYPH